jgi:hypothetical protein
VNEVPQAQISDRSDRRFLLGYETLGPIFIGIVAALLDAGHARNVSRMLFVARDAHLLFSIAELLRKGSVAYEDMRFEYILLSRRLLALPSLSELTDSDIRQALRVGDQATDPFLRFCHYFNLPPDAMRASVGADDTPLISALQSSSAKAIIAQEQASQRILLTSYLDKHEMFSDVPKALVDVGWRGSIQSGLSALRADQIGKNLPIGIYVGLWSDDPDWSAPCEREYIGAVSDIRKGRTLKEGAAWYASALIEALTRAEHGTVVGLQDSSNGLEAKLEGSAPSRIAEIESDGYRRPIIEGILQRAKDFAEEKLSNPSLQPMAMIDIQSTLLRLAFSPSKVEIEILGRLVVTEGNAPQWSSFLVPPNLPNPLRAPKQWVAGLSSPWRGAYVKSSAGPVGSAFNSAIERVLLKVSPRSRERIRLLLKRISS